MTNHKSQHKSQIAARMRISGREEMVAAYGIGDWGWLEEMLGRYLRANDVDTHCAIVADRSKCPTGSGAGDDR